MTSKILRRSGFAIVTVADLLEWKPDAIVQVGVGQYHEEVNVMLEKWPDARLVGFEPHPDIVILNYPGELKAFAIGYQIGKAILHDKPRHKDGASLFPHLEKEGKEIEVQVTTLDMYFPGYPKQMPGEHVLLWLDCEGSELNALQGGERFVRGVEVINIEMTSKPPGDGWCDIVETHHWLVDHGFYRQSCHTHRTVKGQADCIYVRRHLFRPEYCCDPNEIERYGREVG